MNHAGQTCSNWRVWWRARRRLCAPVLQPPGSKPAQRLWCLNRRVPTGAGVRPATGHAECRRAWGGARARDPLLERRTCLLPAFLYWFLLYFFLNCSSHVNPSCHNSAPQINDQHGVEGLFQQGGRGRGVCGWHRARAEPVLAAPAPAGLAAFRAGRWGSPNADQQRNPPRPVPLDPGLGTGTGGVHGSEPGRRRVHASPRWTPSPQTLGLLRARETSVLAQKCLSASRAGRCVLPAFGASLCSFRFVQFPTSQIQTLSPGQGLPFPSHPRVACSARPAFAVVLVPPSSCGSRLETKLRPGEPAGPAMGSASPRLRPPLLALAHAQGSLPVAISPGLLLPSFSFGPLKK